MVDWTVAYPVADAVIDVDPGEKVEVKVADAKVWPFGMVIDGLTVPMFVRDDDRVIVVSWSALAGFWLESCNSTKMHVYELLSARTLVGPTYILRFAGSVVAAYEMFGLIIMKIEVRKITVSIEDRVLFRNFFTLFRGS